jgi:ubiquinone biosynthesis protein UbiJ
MLLTPLLTAGLETALNRLLYREPSMKAARLRLAGKILRIRLQELDTPLTLIFSERQADVVGEWAGEADCTVSTRLGVLMKLRDRQQLSPLMRQGELIVDGDLQVVQQLVALLDMAEWEPADLLAPYLGDIAAQGIAQSVQKGAQLFRSALVRRQGHLGEVLTEEWKLAPAPLEIVWFNEEVDALARELDRLDARINAMETKS